MAETIPAPAIGLLAFIASYEAPKGYDTVYGNKMAQMPRPLTSMSLNEVIADGPRRTKAFGSSACGRYQFMTATLKDLQRSLVLMGNELFTPALQDRLGYELLKRRGYIKFALGAMSVERFGLALAQEWASFPVLSAAVSGAHRAVYRGQSYYSGDGANKALVKPEAVEAALAKVLAASREEPAPAPLPAPSPVPPVAAPAVPSGSVVVPVPTVPGAVVVLPPADTRTLWQRVADRLRAAFPVNKA